MSKDNASLRLLGSPVNLTSRNKKKDDRKNIRNRPRSALQNSCYNPDNQERYKRPFSADTKERTSSTRNFYKTFSSDLLQTYKNYPVTTIKVVPPTADLLSNLKSDDRGSRTERDRDICSNASDIGSEDTFISLGTKIKNKAQLIPRLKSPSGKNIKYRSISKKSRKSMENTNTPDEKPNDEYGMEVKITERGRNQKEGRSPSPTFKRSYDAYFIPLEGSSKSKDEDLAGRVSFGSSNIQTELEQAIDTYSRRLTLTKQQLSLVEEESTQDIESPSQGTSCLSPGNLLEDPKKNGPEEILTGRNTYIVEEKNNEFPKTQNFMCEERTYTSFYDDFRSASPYRSKNTHTIALTDSSSKDSGYPDSGHNSDGYRHNFSLPSTSLKKSSSQTRIEDQPKSLDSASSNEKDYKTFPLDKKSSTWAEPLNHSRLLYKDFFLKKEGHIAMAPHNSPVKENNSNPSSNEIATDDKKDNHNKNSDYPSYLLNSATIAEEKKSENQNVNADYPSYLLNSTTKAYTSKVIEDYKKEIETINSLHELTIRDIKTDAISPTPLNIDKMFEQHSGFVEEKHDTNENPQSTKTNTKNKSSDKNKNSLDINTDISKVSTKELIQKYFDVKRDYGPKNLKKYDYKKTVNIVATADSFIYKQDWNNKFKSNAAQVPKPSYLKNQTQKNLFTLRPPLSARIESVQNDKDIDSWMSMATSSPRNFDAESMHSPQETFNEEPKIPERVASNESGSNQDNIHRGPSPNHHTNAENTQNSEQKQTAQALVNSSTHETVKSKELNKNSTVLDIYSMLKEIESFGDNPVTSVAKVDVPETAQSEVNEKRNDAPKDNFMEIFEYLEKVEQSANDALNVVTTTTPQTIPKLEALLKLPHTELAQRLVTLSLQLEERSCCIALLQESLTNHKEQMINKISCVEKQSHRNIAKVKQECEETIKRHQNFIDQLINDKKTLNHRIEQLVDERRSLEERWKRSAQALEERYKLELRNQHDKMAAAQQVARQRWVRQKAEKIKELTVKGLEGELREMAERQQKEIADMKMFHAEHTGRMQAKHAAEMEELRRTLEEEKEAALCKERHMASSRLEKQILELELTYQEQRTRLVAEMRAENERAAMSLSEREKLQREELEKWKEEQERMIFEKRMQLEKEIAKEKENMEDILQQKQRELEQKFEQFKKDFEAEQQIILKKKVTEIAAQHKQERDREIEKAIESMEAEAQQGRKELQEALRRNKEQYEAELKSLAETEQATLRRYQDAQTRIRHTEDRCAELEVTISQLETRNKVLTEKNIQLENQAEEMKAQCDKAWHAKVDSLQREMEDMKKTHEEQMHQLYAKVKVAVARKDSAIQALTREAAKYQEKIAVLESKLQQQRKDFLKQVK